MKRRGLASPELLDAIAYIFAEPVALTGMPAAPYYQLPPYQYGASPGRRAERAAP